MAGKKDTKVEEKPLLGRPGNNLKSGIVGLANVGKSTFFQAITRSPLGNPANYPFATIDPEEARVIVPSPKLETLFKMYHPPKKVPAFITVYDIAGLTKGASKGEGLGNAFLSNIRAVDAIYQVVRCFKDPEITHIEGDVDPVRDLDIISTELRLKDIEFATRHLEATEKVAARGGQSLEVKKAKNEVDICKKVVQALKDGKRIANLTWDAKEVNVINEMQLLTAKPCIYLVNLSEKSYIRKRNKWLPKIVQWVQANSPDDAIIPISICLEERLSHLETDEAREEEEKRIGAKSVLPKIITVMRQKLHLISFFTAGETDEVREWTIREGTKAPQAAGVIHTDLMNTFIMANVMKVDDLVKYGSEAKVRAAGKLLQKGKDYVVEDGDVIYFKATAGKS